MEQVSGVICQESRILPPQELRTEPIFGEEAGEDVPQDPVASAEMVVSGAAVVGITRVQPMPGV